MKRSRGLPTREVLLAYLRDNPGRPSRRRIARAFAIDDADQGALASLLHDIERHGDGAPRRRAAERGPRPEPALPSPSAIAIETLDLPVEFPAACLRAAERLKAPGLEGRVDLRALPLVTIDDEDARDFDDAVFAEPDGDGHRIVVAIADVAWFVRPGDALDRAARERGNSAYFPDRVLPMLPERLSNDLCSLRPEEDRACLVADMRIDAHGKITQARFTRALMRSAARLTYANVESAHRGEAKAAPVARDARAIERLYGAFAALERDRQRRGALELDLEERQVMLDAAGAVTGVRARPRYSSHRLIEAFMIAANVAAAQALTDHRNATLFRVHDDPDRDRLEALRETLAHLGYRLAKGQVIKPAQFNRILEWANDRPFRHLVHTMVLRTQSMAVYHPANRGHFGLGLARYLHFTSPIRRYADLIVHRALIARFALGEGGHPRGDPTDWTEVARHVSDTERRAAAAERQSVDLFLARFLADRRGAEFSARVSGVTRHGVFVTLDGIGADGLIPMSRLPIERYTVDDRRHRLLAPRGRVVLTLGDQVDVRLTEINLARGRLAFEWLPGDPPAGTRSAKSRHLP